MACFDQIPVISKEVLKAVTTIPGDAGHGKIAKEFRGITRTSPASGPSWYEDNAQRSKWRTRF